jgi:hypothetical protein
VRAGYARRATACRRRPRARRPRSGIAFDVIVDAKRTSFELYHKLIKQDGKPFDPTNGTKSWFAEAP